MLLESGLGVADLDHCCRRNAETRKTKIDPWARKLCDEAKDAYREVTVSGSGLRLIGRASGPALHRRFEVNGTAGLELYRDTPRFITISGLRLKPVCKSLPPIDEFLDRTLRQYEHEDSDYEWLIEHGAARGDRSDLFQSVVWHLANDGWSLDKIVEKLSAYPDGIAAKYVADDRLEEEVGRSFRKWEQQGHRRAKSKPKARYALTRMSAVKEKPVDWYWDGFIPAGVVTTVYGDSDVGKSTMLLDIAARTTRGDPLPACKNGKNGSVIILTKEDALAGILKPRLRAAKADMDKVYTITHEGTGDDDLPPEVIDRLDMGLDEVERIIADIKDVRLIVIDVWASFVGDVKTYDDSSVRTLLEPLANLAARYEIAIVGISHLNKKSDQSVKQRAIGGVGFINVPRASFLIARDPDNPEERRIMRVRRESADWYTS